uniref:hypothetical protein n=1 Tax=Pseudomonas sp. JAI120 TaxID=2723063 RepID=UPI0030EB1B30
VICDPNALAATAERNFSPSKNRSKRVLKKLIKRYGSEFKMVPAIFNMQGRIIAHPDRYAELRAMFKEAPR